ncbi:unnamed protein product [Clonostachys rosea]|uniref:Uncharacterized protein n=1 Tax=Bionectria ochroleuca TaxID=29856 RepID=A0ABY6U1R3_BIOOC|nr:unnamed protein product [Clonostachys rosea]
MPKKGDDRAVRQTSAPSQPSPAPEPTTKPKLGAAVRKPRLAPGPYRGATTRARAKMERNALQQVSMVRSVIPKISEKSPIATASSPPIHVSEVATAAPYPAYDTQGEAELGEMATIGADGRICSPLSARADVGRSSKPEALLGYAPTQLEQGASRDMRPQTSLQMTIDDSIVPQPSNIQTEAPGHSPDVVWAAEGEILLRPDGTDTEPRDEFTVKVSNNEAENKRWHEDAFARDSMQHIFWGKWEEIDSNVGIFQSIAFPCIVTAKVEWQYSGTSTKAKLLALTPKAERYFESELGGAVCLFEAWIWQLLVKNLFSPDCVDKWSGPEWVAFGKLDRAFRGDVTHADNPFNFYFHGAKERMARMLYMKHGSHVNTDRLKEVILTEIAPVTRYKEAPAGEASQLTAAVLESLDEMIKLAVNIDLIIIGCRYHVVVEMHHPVTGQSHGFLYEQQSTQMERFRAARAGSKRKRHHGRPVDLIMRPSVRAYGEKLRYSFGKNLGDVELVKPMVRRYNICAKRIPILVCVDQFPPNEATEHMDPDDRTDTEYHDSDAEEDRLALQEYVLANARAQREQREQKQRERDQEERQRGETGK